LVDNQGERDALDAARKRKSAGSKRKRELTQKVRAAVMQRKEAADVTAKAAAKGEPVNPSDEDAPLPIFFGY